MMTKYNDITRFILILISLLLIGCQSESVERYRNGNVLFKTTAPSILYFKNIKSTKYQTNRDPKTQMDFYHPKIFAKDINQPIIYPIIVHNWLEDESYLIFEKRKIAEGKKIVLKKTVEDSILLELPGKDYLSQLAFVRKLEVHLRIGGEIEIIEDGKDPTVVKYSLNERRSFSIAVQDSLKLTETPDRRIEK